MMSALSNEMSNSTYALMKPKEQNWHSQPAATVCHAARPPSGGVKGVGGGGGLASSLSDISE